MRAVMIALLGLGLVVDPAWAARTPSRADAPRARVQAPAAEKARPTPSRPTAARVAPRVAPPVAPRVVAARPAPARVTAKAGSAAKPAAARGRATWAKPRSQGAKMAANSRHPLTRGLVSPAAAASLTRSVRWTHGLPPAAGIQSDNCPSGTMATLARGHDDVVRCLPI